MKNLLWNILIVGGLIVGFAVVSRAQPKPLQLPEYPIALDELRDRGLEGMFRRKLGTIIELKGVVERREPVSKGDDGVWVRVQEVEGKPLTDAIVVAYRQMGFPLAPNGSPIGVGQGFRCVGYEEGCFTGAVPGEAQYRPPVQQRGFGLQLSFQVLKLEWARQNTSRPLDVQR